MTAFKKNINTNEFVSEILGMNLIIIGIGKMFLDAVSILERQGLADIEFKSISLLDGNKNKHKKKLKVFKQEVEVRGYEALGAYTSEDTVILVTSQQYEEIIYNIKNKYDNLRDSTYYVYPDMRAKDLLFQEKVAKRFVLFNIPTHSNIGDHAIASAEVEFLGDNFPYEIIEITREDFNFFRKNLKDYIDADDILIFTGGGNIGTLWESNNDVLLGMLEDYPNNKVLIFPQTIYYSDDEYGRKKHNESLEIYNNHENLTICARDERTYTSAVKDYSCCQVVLMPDMVLYMNHVEQKLVREGILLCLKNDKESVLNEENKDYLKKVAEEYAGKVIISDTIAKDNIDPSLRNKFIEKKIREFKESELIITDRLHGMIFAAISNTPCIALNNVNHKMKYTYKWFKNLSHINFVDNIEDISESIIQLKNVNGNYDDDSFKERFDELANVIRGIINS